MHYEPKIISHKVPLIFPVLNLVRKWKFKPLQNNYSISDYQTKSDSTYSNLNYREQWSCTYI